MAGRASTAPPAPRWSTTPSRRWRPSCAPATTPTTAGVFAAAARTDELVAEARAATGELLGAEPERHRLRPEHDRADPAVRRGRRAHARARRRDRLHPAGPRRQRPPVDDRRRARRRHGPLRRARSRDARPPAAAVERVLTERTRWVAVANASNAVGTITDLHGIVAAAKAAGARVYVDAVHAAPHRRIDLAALGADASPARPTSGSARTSASSRRRPSSSTPTTRTSSSRRPTRCPTATSSARCPSSRSPG